MSTNDPSGILTEPTGCPPRRRGTPGPRPGSGHQSLGVWWPPPRAGMTVQEVADRVEVHRTIAHRLLATLTDHHLTARWTGQPIPGRWRVDRIGQWSAIAPCATPPCRSTRELAEELQSTVALLVREGEDAASAIAVATPVSAAYHLAFRNG